MEGRKRDTRAVSGLKGAEEASFFIGEEGSQEEEVGRDLVESSSTSCSGIRQC